MPQPDEGHTRHDRAGWLSTGAALLLACAVLLPLLGHKPLTDWDEGIYAEVSREMLTSGWLTPHWNGMIWLEKPPLMLWIGALLFQLFGVSEFCARTASAFSGVTLVAVVHGWLLYRKSRLAAWLSTIFLLATPGILHICRVGEMDAMLSLFTVIALIGLAELDSGNDYGWYAFCAGFALALMTKGAASVVIPLTLVIMAVLGGWRRWNLNRDFWLSVLLFLALTLPWHLEMWHLYHRRFLEEYLGFHVLVRATQQIEGHVTPWWYFGTVLLSYASPFILVYPFAIRSAWRAARLCVWCVFPVVIVTFFSFIQTRLPHYIAPAYPAFAILSACLAADSGQRHNHRPRLSLAWAGSSAGIAVVWVASLIVTSGLRNGLHRTAGEATHEPRDRRESIDLARLAATEPIPGPLLVWRGGAPASIAAEVFYSRRHVQQVQAEAVMPGPPRNRYAEARTALADEVSDQPHLLLIDNALLSRIPAADRFTPVRSGRTVTLGTIVRTP